MGAIVFEIKLNGDKHKIREAGQGEKQSSQLLQINTAIKINFIGCQESSENKGQVKRKIGIVGHFMDGFAAKGSCAKYQDKLS